MRRNCSFFSCKDVDMVAKRGGTNILAQAAPPLFPFLHFQQSPPPLPRHDFYDYKVLMKKHKYQIEKRFKLQKYIVASRNTNHRQMNDPLPAPVDWQSRYVLQVIQCEYCN